MEGGEGRKEIERLTAEGLAEGYRLAFEAREAIRSRYETGCWSSPSPAS